MSKITYSARCHCGKIRFSFRAETITAGLRCNCSICIRKGALMSTTYIPAEDFDPIENVDELADYRWNDRVVNHLFCKTCGIYPYHGDQRYGYRVNLGCVEQSDPLALEVRRFDGKPMPSAEKPGPPPSG
ncbi:MAG: GFA family protein, partial [Myxococcales bacterium]|nr:GFA family protein [Myxococcales bacterium]